MVPGDLLHPQSFESAIRNVDYVIHIAGVTKAKLPSEYFKGNVIATRNLLDISSRLPNIRKFCFVSSLTAVGPSIDGRAPDERAVCRPITSYGRSKLEAEEACREYRSTLPLVILRPPTVYGPRDTDVLELFRTAKFGIQPSVGSKNKTLSLLFGPDLAEAIVEATISEKTAGNTYFVADPRIYELSRIFDIIADLVGSRSRRLRLPASLVYSAAVVTEFISFFGPKPAVLSVDKARDLAQDHWVCSPEALRRDIGYVAKTPAVEGLQKTYSWYRTSGWL